MSDFIPTEKYLDITALALSPLCNLLVAEGTIRASKTEFFKAAFMFAVFDSDEDLHLIAAPDLDSINDNILGGEHGLFNMFPNHLELKKDKIGGYYVNVKGYVGMKHPKDKKILLAGFSNANKWKKILGKTLGIMFIDEVNTANKQFVDECFARQASVNRPLQLWTLNGDVPTHWIYTDYINRCNIVKKYRHQVPASIIADMDNAKKQKGWFYVHWNMRDNPTMSEEKIERTSSQFPVGSYYHTIKILGERGAPGKLIYIDYLSKEKNISSLDQRSYSRYGVGVDIGARRAKNSFALVGFNHDYTEVGVFDKMEFQQLGYEAKKEKLIAFVRSWLQRGVNIEFISIDSAEANFIEDIAATFKRLGFPPVIPSYKATIKQRIDLVIILLASGRIKFNNTKEGISVYDAFSVCKWVEGKEGIEREDLNLPHNDVIDSVEYALTRHMHALSKASKNIERRVA